MLTLIDLGLSNLGSVAAAFRRVGADVTITDSPDEVERAGAVVLPGVGAFGEGMASLRAKGLEGPLKRHALERRGPLLGICLGMQILADEGEEHGRHTGLGLVRGRVIRLDPSGAGCRVPNMGWSTVRPTRLGVLFDGFQGPSDAFYFAHSYHLVPDDPQTVAAVFDYGSGVVVAALEAENLFGVQFHPEKSQDAGLNVLERFVQHVSRVAVGSPGRASGAHPSSFDPRRGDTG